MTGAEIARVIEQMGLRRLSEHEAEQFETYLELLLRWNARLNLSSVRDPGEIVKRHFAESIQCATAIPAETKTLLDYGSGAGFPGIPCAICLRQVQCTLAESQRKKASFLKEVVRELSLDARIHADRVETLPGSTTFDVVGLRAVDRMESACVNALGRVGRGGYLLVMGSEPLLERLYLFEGVCWNEPQLLAGSSARYLRLGMKL